MFKLKRKHVDGKPFLPYIFKPYILYINQESVKNKNEIKKCKKVKN